MEANRRCQRYIYHALIELLDITPRSTSLAGFQGIHQETRKPEILAAIGTLGVVIDAKVDDEQFGLERARRLKIKKYAFYSMYRR